MRLLDRFKEGLQKTHARLAHELKRIVTRSPKLDGASLEELEALLLAADFGVPMTTRIVGAVQKAYETQGRQGADLVEVARREIERSFNQQNSALVERPGELTVISMVGVNGSGKTTTAAKLAHAFLSNGQTVTLAACDTFRAAAIEQLKTWGQRLNAPVIAGAYGADPAAIAHDAVSSALARKSDYLLIDTAGRLHTKHNLMQELQKLHRVIGKQLPGAPHEVLLVLDAATGMNALTQAIEFHKAVHLTGLVVTKLDGTSKAGMVVAIHDRLGLPIKWVGLGEGPEDLQPFDPQLFTEALFED